MAADAKFFGPCLGEETRRMGKARTPNGSEDRPLLDLIRAVVPPGVAGFIQQPAICPQTDLRRREMASDGAELYIYEPHKWLKYIGLETHRMTAQEYHSVRFNWARGLLGTKTPTSPPLMRKSHTHLRTGKYCLFIS